MTGIPVRHTQFASWFDPDAWMEKMSGPRWESVLKEEAALVKDYQQTLEVQKRLAPFRAAFDAAKSHMANDIPFESGPVKITYLGQFFKVWHTIGSKQKHEVRDLAVTNDYIYCTEDVGQGAEDFELQCWKIEGVPISNNQSGCFADDRFPVIIDIQGRVLSFFAFKTIGAIGKTQARKNK